MITLPKFVCIFRDILNYGLLPVSLVRSFNALTVLTCEAFTNLVLLEGTLCFCFCFFFFWGGGEGGGADELLQYLVSFDLAQSKSGGFLNLQKELS